MDNEDKKRIILAISIFAVGTFIWILCKTSFKKVYKDPYETAGYIVGSYYEDIIYNKSSDPENFARQFENSGITFNIDEVLKTYKMDVKVLKDNGCEYKKGTVTIKPVNPYGKTDYTYDVSMECSK